MSLKTLLGLAVALGCVVPAGSATAQDSFEVVSKNARRSHHDGMPVLAGLDESDAFGSRWSVNTFFIFYRDRSTTLSWFWAIRRVVGGHNGSTGVVWADSRTCPGVEMALLEFERLPPVQPFIRRLGPDTPDVGPMMDGGSYTAWTNSAVSGEPAAHVRYEVSGNVNSPIATWWNRSMTSLEGCWTASPPP
jgi:hypothetical protein